MEGVGIFDDRCHRDSVQRHSAALGKCPAASTPRTTKSSVSLVSQTERTKLIGLNNEEREGERVRDPVAQFLQRTSADRLGVEVDG